MRKCLNCKYSQRRSNEYPCSECGPESKNFVNGCYGTEETENSSDNEEKISE